VVIACSQGGTSIEDLAEKYPDSIIKVPIDINEGITDAQATKVCHEPTLWFGTFCTLRY
jgi:succinyl-CoA synthetase beta subunit